jgi:two-component system OmpR family response regulator
MLNVNSSPSTGLRVLCVDDDRDTADTLGVLLEMAGFEPLVCYSGEDAIASLHDFRPDACILDLTMPGISGCEVARRLRAWADPRPIPLVAVTGLDGEEARQETTAAGFDLHLTKPVDPDKLGAVLADMVILRGDSLLDTPMPAGWWEEIAAR